MSYPIVVKPNATEVNSLIGNILKKDANCDFMKSLYSGDPNSASQNILSLSSVLNTISSDSNKLGKELLIK